MNAAYHSILVHMTTGPLILAFLAATFRFWLRPQSGIALTIWRACDPIAFYSTLFGIILIVMTFFTGLMLRPMEAFLNSPITTNKIVLALLTIICWYAWILLRLRLRSLIWDRNSFHAHFAWVMCLAGTIFIVSTNSIGGQLAGNPSGYEQFAQALGFRTRYALYFPTLLNVGLWVIGIAALIGGVLKAMRRPDLPKAASRSAPIGQIHSTRSSVDR